MSFPIKPHHPLHPTHAQIKQLITMHLPITQLVLIEHQNEPPFKQDRI